MNYRINTPRIVYETIDDETIIIDFETGTYYSVRETANRIWQLIHHHQTLEEINTTLLAEYTGSPVEIEAVIRQFIEQLVRESLIVEEVNSENSSSVLAPEVSLQQPFVPPILEQYTDMQDLLLLDPIHEVDAQGWPLRKE